ncbi:Ig-like domain-containing protein [Roseomonas sp. AR75]|uniref:Ig-like domain-containing protein n=1 Tax=Roseomonas sp. AR75 TaxID=2562311 RepID=UPI001484DF7E|nr:Ig-like domain-containing protein [Roseomonas sp. AR75]
MDSLPTTTASYIWFGTRAVDFANGKNTGAQLEELDDAGDFATRTFKDGSTADYTGTEWQQFLAFSATQADLDAFNAANANGIDLSDGVDVALAGQVDSTGDLRVGEGVDAHNIADLNGGRIVDVSGLLDDADDPIRITGLGKAGGGKLDAAGIDAADTGNRVMFSNDLGFGLIGGAGFDPNGNAARINNGESIDFEIRQDKVLLLASFTVKVLGDASTAVLIDSDGATIRDTNGDAQGGFVQDESSGELNLGDLAHGTKVTIDYVNQTILFDESVLFAGDAAAFFAAFAAGGSNHLTLGSVVDNQVGWSADDLVLVTDVAIGTPTNRAPLAQGFAGGTGEEDTGIAGQVNATDPDGDTLAYAIAAGDGPSHGSVSLDDATSAFLYTPEADFSGTDSFVVTITDGNGGSATQVVSVTVTPVNDDPTVSGDASGTGDEDTTIAGDLDAEDVDGDTPAFSILADATHGTASIDAATGAWEYVPDADFNGNDSFVVLVEDGQGGSVQQVVSVTAAAVNDGPVAIASLVATNQGEAASGWLTAFDVDDGDTLDFALETGPAKGAVVIAADGSFTYTPDAGETGSDSFSFTVTDGAGATATATVAVEIAGATAALPPGYVQLGSDARHVGNTAAQTGFRYHDIAALPGGGYVQAWTGTDSSGQGVFVGRFDAAGQPLGAAIQANTYTSSSQFFPSLATLADGGFVVTWASQNQDGSGYGIYGQRYDAAGSAIGAEFRANTFTDNHQEVPSVAALADGGFVVTWMSIGQDGSGRGIYGQRYDAAGAAAGAEFRANTYTSSDQSYPSVAALAGGGFVVTWMSIGQDGSGSGIYGQRYNAAGNAAGAEFRANTFTTIDQRYPSVAALADGGFVVTWASQNQDGSGSGIYGQRYNAAGNAAGAEFRANTTTSSDQSFPSVAALADGGFVVTWMSVDQDGNGYGIYGQRYDAAGSTVGGETYLHEATFGRQQYPRVAELADGTLAVAFNDNLGGLVVSLDGEAPAVDAIPSDYAASPPVVTTSGFSKEPASLTGARSVAALADGGFVATWMSNFEDGSFGGIYGQRYDAAGNATGAEFRANTTTSNDQSYPAVAALADGGFVVTWQSYLQDGSGSGIYGQRYDAAGNPAGAEFRANTYTSIDQAYPAVAALADGGFVVTWMSNFQDGSFGGIYGQRYDAAGNATGAEFRANTYTSFSQYYPSVTTLADGGFVVTWSSSGQDGSGWGIYGQRYDAAGNAAGAEFRANTYTDSDQSYPSVTALAEGGFVVTWMSNGQDGGSYGIYGQRYDAAGNAAGAEFRANTYNSGDQSYPSVAALADGGFVVTWMSYPQDGSGYGIYGQRYDAGGNADGPEFRLSAETDGDQLYADLVQLVGGELALIYLQNSQIATRVLVEVTEAIAPKDIAGTPGNDVLLGAEGEDSLSGAAGNDILIGGTGNDSLTDGPGADTLSGGAGEDILAFTTPGDLGDRVTDFTQGEDLLDLTALHGGTLVFEAGGGAVLSQAYSVSVFQDGGDSVVIADLDGDPAAAEFRVTLTGTHALTEADFIL